MPALESLLEEARKRLVETGTRNRLIHVNRAAKRANVLNIINERSDDIFEILRLQSKKMRFAGKGDEADELDSEIILASEEEFDESRYTDLVLETPLTPDALQKRLLRLASDSKTAEEEQGINILYLNLGFLQWYEDKNSEVMRESPLILLPVELVRNDRSSTYDIRCRDDDIMTNLPLQERLKLDFGISLPEIDDSEDWEPTDYFQKLQEAISTQDRWNIDPDGMQLGFFSFAKLLMLRDLDPADWDEGHLLNNPIIKGLLAEGFENDPPLFDKDTNLDEVLDPQQIVQIVDADSSQTKVIEEVRSGKNLVVQGPPGTGKSQTIANILAGAAYDGKSVLFVAEKMAALDVVHRRLVKVGLKDICLELHSRTANKRAFLEELATTLANGRNAEIIGNDASEVKRLRDLLNEMSSTMHSMKGTVRRTPHEVLSNLIRFAGNNAPPPTISTTHLVDLTHDDELEISTKIKHFCDLIASNGPENTQPFRGSNNLSLQPTDLLRLVDQLEVLEAKLNELIRISENLANILKLDGAASIHHLNEHLRIVDGALSAPVKTESQISICYSNVDDQRFIEALEIADDWTTTKNSLSDTFNDSSWDQSVAHLRLPLVKGSQSWLSKIFGKYRSASKEFATLLKTNLPKSPEERLILLDQLVSAQDRLRLFNEEKNYLESKLQDQWRNERTPFGDLLSAHRWLLANDRSLLNLPVERLVSLINDSTLEDSSSKSITPLINEILSMVDVVGQTLTNDQINATVAESAEFADLLNRVSTLREQSHTYDSWVSYKNAKDSILALDLSDLISFAEENTGENDALTEFLYSLNEGRWNLLRQQRPELNQISQTDRHNLVDEFRKLETERIKNTSAIIRTHHLSKLPQGAVGEMGVIRGEIAKKRKHKSIRQVISQAGSMVQRIKPIFLMSPISVAQFIPPEKLDFDLLVIDEASQVKPEDALGSIARAKQIIVVGDQKQLPPTSFFDRLTDNIDEVEEEDSGELTLTSAVEMESVLSLCEARGLNQCMLEWHYRSRDPSLITVSNLEFYGNSLILPPSPTESDESFGLKLTRVPGVYSSKSRGGGRAGTNRIEAEHIVARVAEIARNRGIFSVGIVTFSKSQADMMTEVLEFKRREDPILDEFLRENKTENVFVKNIENVQGDERDIILISVGYGPHEPNATLPSMNFGPINSEGGERRLNVLFSRSRVACEVFTSFDPRDIDTTRTSKIGPKILKRFLEYADTGHIPEELKSEGDADSPFEEDVAQAITSMGYQVDHQVGTAGFKIDLGVKSPTNESHYILAVECDGATYHSALWARERDRLRQQILEGFGWTFHRIWSTDWFYRRSAELEKLKEVLSRSATKDLNLSFSGANEFAPTVEEPKNDSVDIDSLNLEVQEIVVPPYKKWSGFVNSSYEPHERPLFEMATIIHEIVLTEGPIHSDEVARRYASAHGKTRVGNRIQSAVIQALLRLKKESKITDYNDFFGTSEQFANPPVRNREHETSSTLKPQYISSHEIEACEKLIKDQSGEVPFDELIRTIAKVFGFKRAGPDFQSRITKVLTGG